MSEDMSFKAADCEKFKGWLKKWQQARIPLLACLFIEILSPGKVLSLAFQDEDIDTVSSLLRLETAKKQFMRIEKKEFEDLPTVSRFLDKVEESNEAFSYQNVVLKSFENAKESARKLKNVLLAKVKQAVEARLEFGENRLVIFACTVLNTEGWERMDEEGEKDPLFADECVTELYSHCQNPLSNAGLDGSLSDLLERWHSVIEYTTHYLSPSTTPYLCVWRRIFDSSRSEGWSMVLLLAELLFSIPISNAKVEWLFSLMNRIKTDSRATLGESTLNSLIRISMEGPKFEEYDPTSAIHLWADITTRQPHQKRRKKYKHKDSSKKRKVLIDDSSTEESAESEESS
ncbi:zinc finger 862-like [Paramuricea clavata]|uniref:Zinc finger 862-like n=1 Tax=Paramuricea clavata TaxID=317549 RepID=A0A7D9LFX9_PARCT|nr:zinc finger 862-like [Paramuricea clavata]